MYLLDAYCFLGLTWLMVYRTEKYQKLKAEVEKQSKKREFARDFCYALKNKYIYIHICLKRLSK